MYTDTMGLFVLKKFQTIKDIGIKLGKVSNSFFFILIFFALKCPGMYALEYKYQ